MWSRILGPWTTAAVLTVVVLAGLSEHRPGSVLFALYLTGGGLLLASAFRRRARSPRLQVVGGLVLVAVVGTTAFLEWREGVPAPRLLFLFALAWTWAAAHMTDAFVVRFATRPASEGLHRLGGPEAATASVPWAWATAALLWVVHLDAGNELADGPSWVALPLFVSAIVAGLLWFLVAAVTWFSVPRWLMWLSPPARKAALRRAGRRREARRRLARAEGVLDDLRRDIATAKDADARRTRRGSRPPTGSAADSLSER